MTDLLTKTKLKELKEKYSAPQLASCVGSRQIRNNETVFGGVGISFLAVAISKLVHTPSIVLITEAGYVGFCSVTSMGSPADNYGAVGATLHQGMFEVLRDQQAGFTDAACLGFAQTDRFGNVNVSYIDPGIRLNGSGGGADIASSAGRIVYVAKYNPRIFREKVDYLTNPGFLDGSPDARERANLVGGGPACIATDRGLFRFDSETKEMYLAEIFPWQDEADIETMKSAIPWELKVADELKIMDPPSASEMAAIELLDPTKRYIESSEMNRPIGQLMRAGRNDIGAYREIRKLTEEKVDLAKKRLMG
jgi:glutaconate CoA-transferase, subunit B